MRFEQRRRLGHLAHLLSDRHVDADQVAAPLVDYGIGGDSGLARRPVTDYQLSLTPAYRYHRVDGLDARLHGGVHRAPRGDARGHDLRRPALVALYRPLAVYRRSQPVHDPAQELLTYRDLGDPARPAYLAPLLHLQRIAQDDSAHAVLFEVQRHADRTAFELQELAGADARQAVDSRYAIADLDDDPDIHHGQLMAELLDLPLDY